MKKIMITINIFSLFFSILGYASITICMMSQEVIDAREAIRALNDVYQREYPLHFAASKNNLQKVQALIKNGYEIDKKNDEKETPLIEAAQNGAVDVVKYLLEKGAKINEIDKKKQTALHKAAFENHKNVVEVLLKNNASQNIEDYQKQTPAMLAIFMRRDDIAHLLLAKGSIAPAHFLNELESRKRKC